MIYNFKSESLNQENFDQDNLINSPPPVFIKIVRVSWEVVDLRLKPPGLNLGKISLKTCNFVTLACKRGSTRKHRQITPKSKFIYIYGKQ